MSQYDLTQTTFIFSWVSNYSSFTSGSESDIASFVDNALKNNKNGLLSPNYLKQLTYSDWELAWGSAVYIDPNKKKDKDQADNTAYVVYSPTANTYILAIAGTNPHDFRDWYVEDLSVGKDKNVVTTQVSKFWL